jgi:hypothetical protein
VITWVIGPGTFRQELEGEPGMNRFIVVEQLEIELPEPDNDCSKKDEKKDPFESKKISDFIEKMSGLLHAAPSTL